MRGAAMQPTTGKGHAEHNLMTFVSSWVISLFVLFACYWGLPLGIDARVKGRSNPGLGLVLPLPDANV